MLAYVPGVTVHAAEDVTLVVDPSLMFAVAVYEAELFSFTEDTPLIVRLLTVAVAAATVKEFVVTLTSPWVEPLLFEFPNQAAW
jgi:hypothetical protein